METLPDFRFVDTHCHLDLYPDPDRILAEISREQIFTVAVTNAPFLFENTLALSRQTEYVVPTLGLHPELVASHGAQIDDFPSLLRSTRFVGEVGLDYSTNDLDNRRHQQRCFSRILQWCADTGDKVLTIHSRRSSPDVLAAIGDEFPGTIILHWFSGPLRDLRTAVKRGNYFSVNPAMIRSAQGRRLLAEIPSSQILTETDGPFIQDRGIPVTPAAAQQVIDALPQFSQFIDIEARSAVQSNWRQILFAAS